MRTHSGNKVFNVRKYIMSMKYSSSLQAINYYVLYAVSRQSILRSSKRERDGRKMDVINSDVRNTLD